MTDQKIPLSERAPEVVQLLADLREQERGNGGGWPGGDTVSILCEWFTANGFDIDSPLPPEDDEDDEDDCCAQCGDSITAVPTVTMAELAPALGPCDACGAEAGEECRPMCTGLAAAQDAAGEDVTA